MKTHKKRTFHDRLREEMKKPEFKEGFEQYRLCDTAPAGSRRPKVKRQAKTAKTHFPTRNPKNIGR